MKYDDSNYLKGNIRDLVILDRAIDIAELDLTQPYRQLTGTILHIPFDREYKYIKESSSNKFGIINNNVKVMDRIW